VRDRQKEKKNGTIHALKLGKSFIYYFLKVVNSYGYYPVAYRQK